MLRPIRAWVRARTLAWLTRRTVVRGFPTTVINARSDIDTDDVIARLDAALGLLEQYVPHHYRRMRRDISGFLVERRAYRGAYLVESRTCLVELTFVVNRSFSLAQVAATILHEAMHARLFARNLAVAATDRHRQERFCRRAEIEFGRLVPGGEAIVQRALDSLALPAEEIAPAIDDRLAMQRVAAADIAASSAPLWLKRRWTRQHGVALPSSDEGSA